MKNNILLSYIHVFSPLDTIDLLPNMSYSRQMQLDLLASIPNLFTYSPQYNKDDLKEEKKPQNDSLSALAGVDQRKTTTFVEERIFS